MGGRERSEAAGRKPWGPLGGPLLKEATSARELVGAVQER